MSDVVTALKAKFPEATERPSADHPALTVPLAELVPVLRSLRDEQAFDLLMDVTAIDWAEGASPRFTVVYHLLSTTRAGSYIRIAANCTSDTEPCSKVLAMPAMVRSTTGSITAPAARALSARLSLSERPTEAASSE